MELVLRGDPLVLCSHGAMHATLQCKPFDYGEIKVVSHELLFVFPSLQPRRSVSLCYHFAGGEDGTVKLVDVLFPGNDGRDFDFGSTTSVLDRLAVAETKAHGASDTDNTHGCSSPWEKRTSTPFCSLPHAKVVQTLPPHESSVGAIAVASEATWPTRLRNEEFEFGGKSLIFSGGGKMELRAWVADEEHESREWTENLSVPPVSGPIILR